MKKTYVGISFRWTIHKSDEPILGQLFRHIKK